jgi:DNA sulfur modification protein DndB
MDLEFPAVLGMMGRRPFYIATVPLRLVPQLFDMPDWAEFDAEQRAQRKLNQKRVPEISRYLIENEQDWVFSSLTAAFNVKETFTPTDSHKRIGVLRLPMTKFLLNDGQHRVAAITEALRENKLLGTQEISVLLFREENLSRNQQIFSDLNRTVQKTSRSLDILYDHRDAFSEVIFGIGERVDLFRNRIDKDRTSLATRNTNVITLSTLYDANRQFFDNNDEYIGSKSTKALIAEASAYWNEVADVVIPFAQIIGGELKPGEARAQYVIAHSVSFWALGGLGHNLKTLGRTARRPRLARLKKVDWSKPNKEWQGILMLGPDIITRRQTRDAMTEMLRYLTGFRRTKPEKVLTVELLAQPK